MTNRFIRGSVAALLCVLQCAAAEHHGYVSFGGLPVPGVTVTAVQGEQKFTAITDQQGVYSFPDLPDRNAASTWTVRIEMLGFPPVQREIAKSIDDVAALGGQGAYIPTQTSQSSVAAQPTAFSPASALTAQNWLDLSGERALSNFDQGHLLSLQAQYTTGTGVRGGTLLSGWKGALFKEWTIATQITAGTGLPLTPTYFAAVNGTGVTGTIRPEYTGAPVYAGTG